MLIIAEEGMNSEAEFAEWLGINKSSFYQIKKGRNPTVEQIYTICKKGGISSDWLLLNEGTPFREDQASITKLMKEIRDIKKEMRTKT